MLNISTGTGRTFGDIVHATVDPSAAFVISLDGTRVDPGKWVGEAEWISIYFHISMAWI